ncbi:MAG: hypothetical protein EPN69_00270 [Rhodanobacter sp.]|nr:MAG: hypothetical protein EPN69_00270 [Rhodanobacter sp.]TAM40946.1 MAG: hypothetical protein EPN58_08650 [Rhodanobacter sp.]TAN25654.1 MAG: hypothetical protein EPN32_08625 [Rhodanobacter sp.]
MSAKSQLVRQCGGMPNSSAPVNAAWVRRCTTSKSIRPVIAESLKLESSPAALTLLGEGRHVGKIVLTP